MDGVIVSQRTAFVTVLKGSTKPASVTNQSARVTVQREVVSGLQGPQGGAGPQGGDGPQGPAGRDGAAIIPEALDGGFF